MLVDYSLNRCNLLFIQVVRQQTGVERVFDENSGIAFINFDHQYFLRADLHIDLILQQRLVLPEFETLLLGHLDR